MGAVFSFRGRMGRAAYGLWSSLIFLTPHALTWLAFHESHRPLALGWRFWAMPLLSLAQLPDLPQALLPLAFFVMLIAIWALTALAFRRTADAQADGWIATLVAAPVIQLPAMAILFALPPRSNPLPPVTESKTASVDWIPAAQGVLAGVGLTLFAVAVGALLFGTYGFGMFVLSPLVIGAATAYLANRGQDIGWSRTIRLFTLALALGGAALVVAALEGIVCIVLAAPLAWLAAWLGAALGYTAAQSPRRRARSTLMSIVLLPLAFASERALPQTTMFATDERIEIDAPPDAVWQALVHMDAIGGAPALPFRLGVAYPLRGEIAGSGVGAIRRGVFSTGVALERVTAWHENRILAFAVLSSPPAMHEISPYRHVNAPHVAGYFQTLSTQFRIVPLPGGRSLVLEHTTHSLRLDPVLYWMPLARWIIHLNNQRVLRSVGEHAINIAAVRRAAGAGA